MNVKAIVISNASKLILGGKLWDDVRHLVSTINGDTKLTGTVGQVTVSTQTDGTIMVENRSGGARNILFHFVAQSNTVGSFL